MAQIIFKDNNTFSNYVNQHIERNGIVIGNHGNPYSLNCKFCKYEYDMIGHLDESGDDFKYLEKKLKLKFSHINISIKGIKTDLARNYFRELSNETIRRLYKVYEFDFKAFGYEYESFLN